MFALIAGTGLFMVLRCENPTNLWFQQHTNLDCCATYRLEIQDRFRRLGGEGGMCAANLVVVLSIVEGSPLY